MAIPLKFRLLRLFCRTTDRGTRLVVRCYQRWIEGRNLQAAGMQTRLWLNPRACLDLDLRLYNDWQMYCFGMDERYLCRWLMRQLNPQSVFIDVGAYIGQYSLLAGSMAPEGRVFTFEPNPTTFGRLQRNLAASGLQNVTLCQAAVGSEPRTGTLYPGQQATASSLIPGWLGMEDRSGAIAVDVVSLDAFARQNDMMQRVNVLKIDAEGNELQVLEGAQQLLRSSRPIVSMETILVPDNPAIERLKAAGYRLHAVNRSGLAPLILTGALDNVVAIPDDAA